MRELTMDELGEVSGAGYAEAGFSWGLAAAIGQVTYGSTWGTVLVLAAFGSPIAATTMIGLALTGGYLLLQD